MKKSWMATEMQQERQKLVTEKDQLLKNLEIVTSNIALLDKFCGSGKREPTPRLIDAAPQAMEAMKRFTRSELAERIKQEHPSLEFAEGSLGKPLTIALKAGRVKLVQPNLGSKTQAVYEWAVN